MLIFCLKLSGHVNRLVAQFAEIQWNGVLVHSSVALGWVLVNRLFAFSNIIDVHMAPNGIGKCLKIENIVGLVTNDSPQRNIRSSVRHGNCTLLGNRVCDEKRGHYGRVVSIRHLCFISRVKVFELIQCFSSLLWRGRSKSTVSIYTLSRGGIYEFVDGGRAARGAILFKMLSLVKRSFEEYDPGICTKTIHHK